MGCGGGDALRFAAGGLVDGIPVLVTGGGSAASGEDEDPAGCVEAPAAGTSDASKGLSVRSVMIESAGEGGGNELSSVGRRSPSLRRLPSRSACALVPCA